MAIANALRATSGAEVGRNLLRNIEMEEAPCINVIFRLESRLSFVSIDKTTFRTARPNIGSPAYITSGKRWGEIHAFEHARL